MQPGSTEFSVGLCMLKNVRKSALSNWWHFRDLKRTFGRRDFEDSARAAFYK